MEFVLHSRLRVATVRVTAMFDCATTRPFYISQVVWMIARLRWMLPLWQKMMRWRWRPCWQG